MKISERAITALVKIITGDSKMSPYRSGPKLVHLFNEFGTDDTYGQGFPSRWSYTEERIRQFNNTDILPKIFLSVLEPIEYVETDFKRNEVVEYLNKYLKYDGYEIIFIGEKCELINLKNKTVEIKYTPKTIKEGHIFINEQISKCEKKIDSKDYDGAITNARSLLEAVLVEIEKEIDDNSKEYDGDLIKLYKRIQKLLNLEPSRKDISDTLKQILTGLTSIVTGISGLRNKMSDAHARSYKPARHHAILAVNSVKTVVNFLFETKQYQYK